MLIDNDFEIDNRTNHIIKNNDTYVAETLMTLLGMKNKFKVFFSGNENNFNIS